MTRVLRSLALAGLLVSPGLAGAQQSYPPPNDAPNPYQAGASFGQLPDGRKWGSTAGVDIAPDGTIWAYDRCGANTCVGATVTPLLHFDKTGKLINAFGAGRVNFPHVIHVDLYCNDWVT